MAITHKMIMPLTKWQEICKKCNDLREIKKDFKVDIEKYMACRNYGQLMFHLTAIEIGAREELEAPEYYDKMNYGGFNELKRKNFSQK